ncbi:MAG: DUF1996 domain-containing protein [Marinicellaceae bacterium]
MKTLITSILLFFLSYSTAYAGTPLNVTLTSVPDSNSLDAYAIFEFSADNANTFECKLDDEVYEECNSPKTYISLSQGLHQFSVRAFDESNVSGNATIYNWEIQNIFETTNSDLLPTSVIPDFVAPNSWRGIFRINCDFSHSSYNDPIVFPNQLNRAHLHRFYGNTIIDHTTTTESLISEGDSSCQGNKLNLSGYWVPALLAPHYDNNGEIILDDQGEPSWIPVPAVVGDDIDVHEIFYYSGGVDDLESIQPLPVGLKMIAGDHMSTIGHEQDTSIVRWHCQSWESNEFENPNFSASIPECVAPDRVRLDIFFPSCWNGVDLDSPDHKSHMAYPLDSGTNEGIICPETHPIPVVRPSYHYAFGVKPDVYEPVSRSSKGWRLASDHYFVDDNNPGGFSLHGDWINGWHPAVMQAILDYCIKGEYDCHDGNLANGFRLSNTQAGTQVEPAVINSGRGTGEAENGIDLWVELTNNQNMVQNNTEVEYVIKIGNNSSKDATDVQAIFELPHQLSQLSWSCNSSINLNCPDISAVEDTLHFNLATNELLTFYLEGLVDTSEELEIVLEASLITPQEFFDTNSSNNNAADRDSMGIFGNSFESN